MSFESPALKSTENSHAHADFGDVLGVSDNINSAHIESPVVNAFMQGPLADMRATFQALLTSDRAGEFKDFITDCQVKAAAGEPAYQFICSKNA